MRLPCRHEPALVRALREGRWPPVLAAHVERCPACRESTRVAERLQTLARRSEAAARLRDPGEVWSRAVLARQMARRRELTRRAACPAVWFQRVAAILAAGATAAWIATAGGDVRRAAAALVGGPSHALLARELPRLLADPWPLALLAGTLFLLVYLWEALGRLARP